MVVRLDPVAFGELLEQRAIEAARGSVIESSTVACWRNLA
jgi:hypothetical protein